MLKNQLEIISRNVYYIRKYFRESQNLKNNNNNEKNNDNTISDEVEDSKNIPINFKIDENDKEFKDFDKKNKSQFDNYFIISFTTIIGYFLKYLLNVILIKYNIKYDLFFYYIIGIYTSSIIISLFFYFLYDCTFKEKENDEDEDGDKDEEEEFEDIKKNENNEEKDKLLKKKKIKKKNKYNVCQICGFTIYSQKVFKKKIHLNANGLNYYAKH